MLTCTSDVHYVPTKISEDAPSIGSCPVFFSPLISCKQRICANQVILVFLSVQTLTIISSNVGGIKRKQQKKRIGGENQESQAGQGEG